MPLSPLVAAAPAWAALTALPSFYLPLFVDELQSQRRAARDAALGEYEQCAAAMSGCLGEPWLGTGAREGQASLAEGFPCCAEKGYGGTGAARGARQGGWAGSCSKDSQEPSVHAL